MSDWQASIFVAAGGGGGEPRMWSLRLHCCKDYPKVPPQVTFTSRIVMDGVDPRGNVNAAKVPYLAAWNAGKNMHGVLTEIKALISRAPRQQAAEGTNY